MGNAARINPALLKWVRERAGLAVEDASDRLGVSSELIERWEQGLEAPTFRQAQKAAASFSAPFGFLFLAEPPVEVLPIPELRRVGGIAPGKPSVDLADTIRLVAQRQHWYVEFLQDHQARPLPFVGSHTLASDPQTIAASMRKHLGVEVEVGQRTQDAYFSALVDACEAIGVLVMRSGIVGNNTHRPLDVAEFRGFALVDPLAPVVFVNSADAPAARLFTLVHELAHVWLGVSGVSTAAPGTEREEERLCNAVAGEFLAPEAEFRARWSVDADGLEFCIAKLAMLFHVSKLVIVRRAFDLGLVDERVYRDRYLAELDAYRNKAKGGGSFYRNAEAKNSTKFARAVLAEALSGHMLLRDAGKLLGIQPSNLQKFADRLGA